MSWPWPGRTNTPSRKWIWPFTRIPPCPRRSPKRPSIPWGGCSTSSPTNEAGERSFGFRRERGGRRRAGWPGHHQRDRSRRGLASFRQPGSPGECLVLPVGDRNARRDSRSRVLRLATAEAGRISLSPGSSVDRLLLRHRSAHAGLHPRPPAAWSDRLTLPDSHLQSDRCAPRAPRQASGGWLMSRRLVVQELGSRPYAEVLELQRSLARQRVTGELAEDLLLLVEHEPVVTLGRGTRPQSLPLSAAELNRRGVQQYEVERGGDATFHGPGQLVGYPILDLREHREDLHWYLRTLEEALIRGLDALAIAAARNPGLTGVWTRGRKIASIGIHVKQWVTFHGFALNINTDLSYFDLIVPCGIQDVVMTSVAMELGRTDGALWGETRRAVVEGFAQAFDTVPVEPSRSLI